MLDANQPWSEISVHGCFGAEIMLSSAHTQEISKHFGENKMMEDALRRYYQRFGENYPLIVSDTKSDEEIIARINDCIENNQLEAEPEYTDNADY